MKGGCQEMRHGRDQWSLEAGRGKVFGIQCSETGNAGLNHRDAKSTEMRHGDGLVDYWIGGSMDLAKMAV